MWSPVWFLDPLLQNPGDEPNLTVSMSMLQQSGHFFCLRRLKNYFLNKLNQEHLNAQDVFARLQTVNRSGDLIAKLQEFIPENDRRINFFGKSFTVYCSTVTSVVTRARSHIPSSEFQISISYPIIILKPPLTPIWWCNMWTDVPSNFRNCAEPPDRLRSEISF